MAGATTFAASTSFGQTLITDNFEADSSADFTIVEESVDPMSPAFATGADGTTDFTFDYVAAGIPLAPRSTAGDTQGIRLTVNEVNNVANGRTLFHNTAVNEDVYRLTVDVYMGYDNVTPAGGTTEFAHVGVGGDGVTPNAVFTPILGSGAFLSFSGDGGVVSDHRWFRAVPNTPPGDPYNTTIPNDDPSYMGNGSNGANLFWQLLFPEPPSRVGGSPSNIWTTVTIDVDNLAGTIQFSYDGTLALDGTFADRFDGQVSLGIKDAFASLSTVNNFTLFDNLLVEGVLPPSVGTPFCPSNPNTTGVGAEIAALGSAVVADNDLLLRGSDLPPGQFGIFVVSPAIGMPVQPLNSNGLLCLTGPVGRYSQPGQIVQANPGGIFSLPADLTQVPTPTALVSVMPGDTYSFQAWFRDAGTSSNFTSGVTVTFL